MKKFEDLLAGVACLSLINEPPQPVEVEPLTALERTRQKWREANVIEGRKEPKQ